MASEEEQLLPAIGYLYHYPQMDHPTDKFRLDIHITSEPTNQHFDVLHVRLPVKTKEKTIRQLKIFHPWNYDKCLEVTAGIVVMEDRKGKKEEAFTFGGRLTIDNQKEQTLCVLVSAAPILEISGATPLHRQFIKEVEIILAKTQAKYSRHQEYEKQLNQTDPFELYLASLEALLEKYEHFPQKTEARYQFLVYLHSRKHRIKAAGLIKKPIPQIDDLFEI